MRFICSEETRKLRKEIEPYLLYTTEGVKFKENTPNEIKEKHKLWEKLYDEESKKAEEILEYK